LSVNFTDASTNAPTSWSWTFGDGGVSSSQNPSHSYAAAGTYDVSLTATNAFGSDGETKSGYVTVTSGGGGGEWQDISFSDFESGWQGWADGGSDARRSSRDNAYAYGGTYCIRLRDNTSTSTMTQGTFNATGYAELEVEFFFYPRSMENNEDFWLQFYNGSSWVTVGSWAAGSSFNNGSFYTSTVNIASTSYNFASNSQFRFRCDASGNSDYIYVDEVTVRGLTAGGSGGDIALGENVGALRTTLNQNSPNPFNPATQIKFSLQTAGPVRLQVYNVRGQLVETLVSRDMVAGPHQVMWSAQDQASGVYFYRLEAPGFSETRKMIMLK